MVLAGPILRRVEASSVSVWLALREPATIELLVYDQELQPNISVQPILHGSSRTVWAGTHLYICAITARSDIVSQALGGGITYFYDLRIVAETGETLQLRHNAALRSAVCFAGQGLPSFALPPDDLNQLRIVHGSCRKPHGGHFDALPALAHMISETINAPNRRPHQLFLTGDQIYADDVADVLLALLIDASTALGCWSPAFPVAINATFLLPGQRSHLASTVAGLTADLGGSGSGSVAKSHLLRFGEFAAMYLFAWSNVLWPATLPTVRATGLVSSENYRESPLETRLVQRFSENVSHVRRALANVPVYMIFDDHEITDDWYISAAWCERVLGNNVGRYTIRNGLLAYTLFQAWGNTPHHFAKLGRPEGRLLDAMNQLQLRPEREDVQRQLTHALGLPYDDDEATTYVADLKGHRRHRARAIPQRPWHDAIAYHYSIRWTSHEVIALDARTWRGYPQNDTYFPALISYEGFTEQILKAHAPGVELTLVIAPAPVFGVPSVESLQRSGSTTGRLKKDNETWSFTPYVLERLLARLAQRAARAGRDARVLLLSGDVHYGFGARFQYWAEAPFESANSGPVRLVGAQLTASALHNETRGSLGSTYTLHLTGYIAGFDQLPAPIRRLGWANATRQRRDVGTQTYLVRGTPTAPLLLRPTSPALVELPEPSVGFVSLSEQPEWQYRIDFMRAEHEVEVDDDTFRPIAQSPADPQRIAALIEYLGRARSDFAADFATDWGDGNEIVGLNNIGELRFQWGAGDQKSVIQLLWWRLASRTPAQGPLPAFPLSRMIVTLRFDDTAFPLPAP